MPDCVQGLNSLINHSWLGLREPWVMLGIKPLLGCMRRKYLPFPVVQSLGTPFGPLAALFYKFQ